MTQRDGTFYCNFKKYFVRPSESHFNDFRKVNACVNNIGEIRVSHLSLHDAIPTIIFHNSRGTAVLIYF